MFFCDRLAGDAASNVEIIPGTPLRMPNTSNGAGNHPVPLELPSFSRIIAALPDTIDNAAYYFQLPDNIERSLQRTTSALLLKQLRILMTAELTTQKYDREQWKLQLAPYLEQWQSLLQHNNNNNNNNNNPIVVKNIMKKSTNNNNNNNKSAKSLNNNNNNNQDQLQLSNILDPVEDFIHMEYQLSAELCYLIDSMLISLKKILYGSGLLTPQITQTAIALLAGTIPSDWLKAGWEAGAPEHPASYLREVVRKRVVLGNKWLPAFRHSHNNNNNNNNTQSMSLFQQPLSLGDLFHPITFLNALRQQTARMLNCAIDLVKLICVWDAASKNNNNSNNAVSLRTCPLPCTLTQLLLQGATFHNVLRDSSPDAPELTSLPSVTLGFVPIDTPDTYEVDYAVTIPVYLSPSREDLVTELQMPIQTANDQDRWILSGVAIFLREDDA
jgi:hypothetical protein